MVGAQRHKVLLYFGVRDESKSVRYSFCGCVDAKDVDLLGVRDPYNSLKFEIGL